MKPIELTEEEEEEARTEAALLAAELKRRQAAKAARHVEQGGVQNSEAMSTGPMTQTERSGN